jgi:hypothetical protein
MFTQGIYNLYLDAIGKYKIDDLKKIATECNLELKDSKGKNKNKSQLYEEINGSKSKTLTNRQNE